jgi:hypothetical protein
MSEAEFLSRRPASQKIIPPHEPTGAVQQIELILLAAAM